MGTLYQAHCARCSYKSPVFPGGYTAVFVDDPVPNHDNALVAGAVLFGANFDCETFAEEPHSNLVVLAHPSESYILEELGHTDRSLFWEGRYISASYVACGNCGNCYAVKRLSSPSALGCLPAIVIGLASGIAVGIWRHDFCFGLALAWTTSFMSFLVLWLVGDVFTRWRFRLRARMIDGPANCPKCKSRRRVSIPTRSPLPCPICHEKALHVRVAGRS
jgi:hypothetical protein